MAAPVLRVYCPRLAYGLSPAAPALRCLALCMAGTAFFTALLRTVPAAISTKYHGFDGALPVRHKCSLQPRRWMPYCSQAYRAS
ncbi:hypothetical protein NPIL_163631 [Nephila pilipes]|uniref:Uncharacterized protein n=1 Tax=Nephila pilipes TaxID=299642 RepID=A0A8X6MS93_NEPPI|nr:hypothetical protein NPIL_163631 [Nephila pilipes]